MRWGHFWHRILLLSGLILNATAVFAVEFQDELEKDFLIRSVGHLQVTNLRGGISIQGWALDKIRVRARRTVKAGTPAEAQKLLSALDFRFDSVDGDIELSAQY